jgi:hypothetical protein
MFPVSWQLGQHLTPAGANGLEVQIHSSVKPPKGKVEILFDFARACAHAQRFCVRPTQASLHPRACSKFRQARCVRPPATAVSQIGDIGFFAHVEINL